MSREWVWKKANCFVDLDQSIMRMLKFRLVNLSSSSCTLSNCIDRDMGSSLLRFISALTSDSLYDIGTKKDLQVD